MRKLEYPLGLLPRRLPVILGEDIGKRRRPRDETFKEYGSLWSNLSVETLNELGDYKTWFRILNEKRDRIG